MDRDETSKGYVYCSHCDNVVSRSTFKRHERKRYSVTLGSDQVVQPSDDQGEDKIPTPLHYLICIIFNFIRSVVVTQMSHCCRIVALPGHHRMAESFLFYF